MTMTMMETQPLSPSPELPPEFPVADEQVTLLPCTICNRTFNPQALDRHRKVCEKLSSKKRNSFSSNRQRLNGLEVSPVPAKQERQKQSKPKSRWREKHQEFLRAIRAAKGIDGIDGQQPTGPLVPSDYVRCPHCDRHFGPKAADRHIDWCREQRTRMPRSPADNQAVERLKSRTKYVPPKPGQNGWRAPKKSDVISSIPPPSSGPTPAPTPVPMPPALRELTPPYTGRHPSPPRSQRHVSPPIPAGRHVSPPPMPSTSTSRRASLASSVASFPGTLSLGRAAGRHFSNMLKSAHPTEENAVTGSSTGYGTSSGYGQNRTVQSSGYGQSSTSGHGQAPSYGLSRNQVGRASLGGSSPLMRQRSTRSSLRRTSSNAPMARRRDLASDMMASVCIVGSPKRGEPEGDEAGQVSPPCSSGLESYSNKLEKEKINNRRK